MQHLLIRHGQGNAAAGADSAQNEEVADGRGHAQAVGYGPGSLPQLGKLDALLEGAHDGGAACALHADHARARRADQPHLLHLVKRLPHPDQAGSPAGGVDDHVRQRPVKLLGDLIAHRLLALDAIRLAQCADVEPAVRGHALAHLDAAVVDQPIDQGDVRPQFAAFDLEEAGHVLRHIDVGGQTGGGGIGAHGAGGVARAGDRQLLRPQLPGAADGHPQPARLEGGRHIQPLVLDIGIGAADGLAQAAGVVQRRPALAQPQHGPVILHRQHLFVAPQTRLATKQARTRQGLRRLRQVIARQQRLAALTAEVDQLIGGIFFSAIAALEVGQGGACFGHNLF